MHWLEARLEELGKEGVALARALKLKKQRVYEMYRPGKNGKLRSIKSTELEPMAEFLGWSLEELMARIEGRHALATHGTKVVRQSPNERADKNLTATLQFQSARGDRGRLEGFMLYGVGAVVAALIAFEIKVLDDKNDPVYRIRDVIRIDPTSQIIHDEDCLFTTEEWPPVGGFCLLARLIRHTPDTWFCRPITGGEPFELDRAEFKNAWPITERRRPT